MLYDIVRKLPEGALLQFEHTSEDPRLILSAGRSRFHLASLPREEFPAMPASDLPNQFALPAATFRRLIDRTRFRHLDRRNTLLPQRRLPAPACGQEDFARGCNRRPSPCAHRSRIAKRRRTDGGHHSATQGRPGNPQASRRHRCAGRDCGLRKQDPLRNRRYRPDVEAHRRNVPRL